MPRIKERFANVFAQSLKGNANWRGIATIASGTCVVSVAAANAQSGAIIHATPYNYAQSLVGSAGNFGQFVTLPVSIGGGAFLIVTAGSIAAVAPLTVGWSIVR